jgi:hypothetical protein
LSDSPEDVIDVALRVARALESVGATYFVGGSLASSLHGEPRATNDIDFVIDIPLGKVTALAAALGGDFEVDSDMLRDAVMHGRSANVFYLPLAMKIDFFGNAHEAYDEAEFLRRRAVVVRGAHTLVVKSAEDTILRKLLWFRAGGEVSDRQWRDILGVLRAQEGNLDDPYLQQWAKHLGVGALLERARAESGSESG